MSLPRPVDQHVRLGSGNTRYWAQGEQGSFIVLIHGITGSVEDWIHNIGVLSRSHRVYAVELASIASCIIDGSDISLDDTTNLVKDFMQTQGIPAAAIVGHSLGGRVAVRFASQFPEMATHLVMATSPGLGKGVSLALRLSSMPHFGDLIMRPSRRTVELGLKSIVYDPSVVTPDMVDSAYRCSTFPGWRGNFAALVREGVDWRGQRDDAVKSTLEDLAHITAPTLVIWGRQDRVLPPSHAEVVTKAVPNTRLILFDHCGHLPQIERAQEFNSAVLEFLTE